MKTQDLLSFAGRQLGDEHYARTYSIADVQRMRGRVSRTGARSLTFEGCDLLPETCSQLRQLGYRVSYAGDVIFVAW